MTTRTTALGISLGLFVGCGPTGTSASFETEGWIDTSPTGPPTNPSTGGDEYGDDGDEGEEGEEGEEDPPDAGSFWEVFALWDGTVMSEADAEFTASDGTQLTCSLFFPVASVAAVTDCAECSHAWAIQLGEGEVDIDMDCASHAVDLAGATFRLGMSGETLYRDEGSGWMPVGGGEAWAEKGELALSWELLP